MLCWGASYLIRSSAGGVPELGLDAALGIESVPENKQR